ncbi:hypothetical protein I5677_02350 [Mobilitalea sibirica]|uniref:Uncharacterized protein n=1 Tax=Mobilitalea sibirica TaxID=1462919 RepID=A0A8J7H0N1_9FIRM|nr:hypothetical protein [Mobilitalea sibirica]MBH1939734.1 hypothetical protein [Mobilitalea sibirica]
MAHHREEVKDEYDFSDEDMMGMSNDEYSDVLEAEDIDYYNDFSDYDE